ncbi:hypothetical protein Ae201684_019132 [Aphanomyces euteiches]|uniref:Uncharacterized protein n=1 Tax=Aphanomyces euteiches TaxID=100861 RepID=A0A6G0W437_9STRA|nr:hypothetical protein Ae201684_019132 [Aphanomyces euteiches]
MSSVTHRNTKGAGVLAGIRPSNSSGRGRSGPVPTGSAGHLTSSHNIPKTVQYANSHEPDSRRSPCIRTACARCSRLKNEEPLCIRCAVM